MAKATAKVTLICIPKRSVIGGLNTYSSSLTLKKFADSPAVDEALRKVKKPPKWNYGVEVPVRGHKWGQMSVIDKRRF